MGIYALIDASGTVTNRVVLVDATTDWPVPAGCRLVEETTIAYEIGGTFVGDVYTPAPAPPLPPPPVPASISDRQFFQQLAMQGVITPDEALAAVRTGVLPAALQQLISTMPTDKQFGATMMMAGATVFERDHPLTIAMGTAYGWTATQIDALWRAAAEL